MFHQTVVTCVNTIYGMFIPQNVSNQRDHYSDRVACGQTILRSYLSQFYS